ncbi:DUF1858 domain-containing protein [Stappia sp.]|uniref:DUF1858 domain-containing protein n=1 Tax=Stappia sp. TaxID=1870903 RepID=UPI003A9975AB
MVRKNLLPIGAETIVGELMATHSATIAVFLSHRMMCVGCPVARLHDLEEACREHGVALPRFIEDLNLAMARGEGAL